MAEQLSGRTYCPAASTPSLTVPPAADSGIPAEGQAEWTVLLYLCGTDLESGGAAATNNLAELQEAALTDNVNYIIQTGGTAVWQNSLISSDRLQRWQMTDGQLTLVDEQPLASMPLSP